MYLKPPEPEQLNETINTIIHAESISSPSYYSIGFGGFVFVV